MKICQMYEVILMLSYFLDHLAQYNVKCYDMFLLEIVTHPH